MIYCDASLPVALLVAEAHSEAVVDWFMARPSDIFITSDWSVTELGSALALKARVGTITADVHSEAVAAANDLFRRVQFVGVTSRRFRSAGERHVLSPPKGLRAGDALTSRSWWTEASRSPRSTGASRRRRGTRA